MSALHLPFRRTRSAGEELLHANRFSEAELAFADEAAARTRDPRPLVGSGHLALMRNDLDRAESLLLEAVGRDGKCREANELLGEASYRRGDFDQAAIYQQAAGNRPVAAKLRSFAGRRPYAIDGPEVVRLPFVRTDPLPVLSARVNGGPEAHYLLDTGGAEVILDTAFAGAAGVPQFGAQRSFFGGGKTAPISHGAIDSIALGDMTIGQVPVHVMDLSAIGPAIGEPGLAGIIGTCLLYRFLATIDYRSEELVLRRRPAVPAVLPDAAIEVPFMMADDHFMLAEGSLNDGPSTLFFVDSGLGGGAFTCPASTLKAAGIERGSTQTVEGQGGGGSLSAWPFDVASLSLGAARLKNLQGIAGPFPPQLEWAYGFRIGGLISDGFLRAYAVTFDFDRMMIRLEPASA